MDDKAPSLDTNEDTHIQDNIHDPESNDRRSSRDGPVSEPLKRKASVDERDSSPKRMRDNEDDRPRRNSSITRGESQKNDGESRKNAQQEEKKRGKRLFGGLLSTLSQTTGNNTQQKRRREIEQRQQERLRKQRIEGDKERASKRARLTEVRMAEQIVFDEEVVSLICVYLFSNKIADGVE